VKARLTLTARFGGDAGVIACFTRDVSGNGLLLDSARPTSPGTAVSMSLLDEDGEVVELHGIVTRGVPGALGVRLHEPPPGWMRLVTRMQARARSEPAPPPRRLRVLVVSDDARLRGAVALYVTSGWDVRFASDLAGAEEALRGWRIDAVIVELDLDDGRWPAVLEAARRAQHDARRIIRSALHGRAAPAPGRSEDLVHRVVDAHAGLDALLDALTADFGVL
jgi:CheY-like chemotaxis protein